MQMKTVIVLTMILIGSGIVNAQNDLSTNSTNTTPSPDISGAFVFEYGSNHLLEASPEMKTEFWKSPTFNVYYSYPIKIRDSHFSFNPAIGIGNEKLGFTRSNTFIDSLSYTRVKPIGDLPYFDSEPEVRNTQIAAHYIDIPLEIRFNSNKENHKGSLYLAIGGKVGFRYDSKTKIKYIENEQNKVMKDSQSYNLNTFRYGAHIKLGAGPFAFWGYYGLNKYFKSNKVEGVENPTLFSFGMSLSTF